MTKLPDIYVDTTTRRIVLDHDHHGEQHITSLTREQAIQVINSLIRGLEELACIRNAL